MKLSVIIISVRDQVPAIDKVLSDLGWGAGNMTVPLSIAGRTTSTHLGLCVRVEKEEADAFEQALGTLADAPGTRVSVSEESSPWEHFNSIIAREGLEIQQDADP